MCHSPDGTKPSSMVKKAIHLNKWEETAAACVWTNPKPEFIELKYYGEIVHGEREGMRV